VRSRVKGGEAIPAAGGNMEDCPGRKVKCGGGKKGVFGGHHGSGVGKRGRIEPVKG